MLSFPIRRFLRNNCLRLTLWVRKRIKSNVKGSYIVRTLKLRKELTLSLSRGLRNHLRDIYSKIIAKKSIRLLCKCSTHNQNTFLRFRLRFSSINLITSLTLKPNSKPANKFSIVPTKQSFIYHLTSRPTWAKKSFNPKPKPSTPSLSLISVNSSKTIWRRMEFPPTTCLRKDCKSLLFSSKAACHSTWDPLSTKNTARFLGKRTSSKKNLLTLLFKKSLEKSFIDFSTRLSS